MVGKRWNEDPLFFSPLSLWKTTLAVLILVVSYALGGCERQAIAPVTITLLDQGWVSSEYFAAREQVLEEFTKETGIHVRVLSPPETAVEQLALWRKLLTKGVDGPDVYGIDVIWSGMLGEYLLDLKPYLAREASAHFPLLVANYTLDGRLVAMPHAANVGVLFYRKDLLQKYGYQTAPRTWGELEKMAARIQRGERGTGKRNFWGFVWEGAPSEALTCNGLEWQVAEGGGHIIEEDKTISVNNPRAIRSWQRAAHWVGSISPPGVVAYRESDALNVWQSGDAAFMRNWPAAYAVSQAAGSSIKNKFDLALLPSDRAGRAGSLGGSGLGVSRSSAHPREAIELVRYLCRRDVELLWSQMVANHSQGDLDSLTPVRSTRCFSFTSQAAVSNAVSDLVVVIAVLVLDEFEEPADLPAKAGFGWWRPSTRRAC